MASELSDPQKPLYGSMTVLLGVLHLIQRDNSRSKRLLCTFCESHGLAVYLGLWLHRIGLSSYLFSAMAHQRHMGEGQQCAAGRSAYWAGPRSKSQCCHHRQSERQDDGKRGPRGFDAGKGVKGRKRHILVDTQGLLLKGWGSCG